MGHPQQAQDPRVGSIIGQRYHLLEVIGHGGMGAVFRAEHVMMRKTVAIKLLHPELGRIDEVARRFEREAQSASRLSHEHIIQVTDFGRTDNGVLFLVMEYLHGEPLADAIARTGGLPIVRALGILRQILVALEHAHALGVVHRDIKPDNIMLARRERETGSLDNVKLLDFGIAKLNDDTPADGEQPLTQAGLVFGTARYMAPEQAMGETVDARADLYSVGVIAYEMLTGTRPFDAESAVAIIQQHLSTLPAAPRDRAPRAGISPALQAVVLRALAKKREDRFQSAAEFRAALEQLEGATAPAAPKRALPKITLTLDIEQLRLRAGRWWSLRSSTERRAIAGIAAAVAVVLLLWSGWPGRLAFAPQPVPPADAAALKPAEEAIAHGDLVTARVLLVQQLSESSSSARVHLLLGNLDFAQHEFELGLEAYRQAIAADRGHAGDAALLANVRDLVDDRKLGPAAVAFLVDDVGQPAAMAIAAIASSDKRAELRHDALAACKRLGCLTNVDRVQSLSLDLTQAKRCEERRDALLGLAALRDKRALQPMRKLKRLGSSNACLEMELEDAISLLEAQ